jgi:cytochrome bd-type quinol oxidase subunit 2
MIGGAAVGVDTQFLGLGGIAIVLLIILIILWFIVATAGALKGEAPETPNRLAQMYGYTVCLVAVIVGLTTASSIVSAAFDRAHPLQQEFSFGASLVSFEAYQATYDRERLRFGPDAPTRPDTMSEDTLRRRYEALVADRLAATAYRTAKTFLTSGILFLVSAALFVVHWRWLQRLGVSKRAAG